ncbi:hypothetical protein GCM10007063_18450 [Lentibacillus kapialis]|uniref:Uncharacterized protein n=1 Tax=Lentibacillus kapialis TaxID=340214 RepID=A0A917PWZ3_9BACI|nr:hypothetical protein GCM10007063_18450 [Lentibacillus kapialis]
MSRISPQNEEKLLRAQPKEVIPLSKQWVKEFILYITKVYGFDEMVKGAQNFRRSQRYKPSTIFIILFMGFVLRLESMEAFDQEKWPVQTGGFAKKR